MTKSKCDNFFKMGAMAAVGAGLAFASFAVSGKDNGATTPQTSLAQTPVAQAQFMLNEDVNERIKSSIEDFKSNGIIPKKMGVFFNVVAKKDNTIMRTSGEAIASYTKKTCDAHMDIAPDGDIGIAGKPQNTEFFSGITGYQNENQKMIRTELLILHEASHCAMYDIKDLFKTGNSKVDKILNQYFKFSKESFVSGNPLRGDASVYAIMQENYADTHAIVQLLRKYGPSHDVLATMQQLQIERTDDIMQDKLAGLDPHHTQHSISELLKEENIVKVMGLKSQAEVQDFSLKIASKGVIQTLRNTNSTSLNLDSIQRGGLIMLGVVALNDLIKTPSSNLDINWENNAIYNVAVQTFKEYKANNDTSSIKTEKDFSDFLENNFKDLGEQLNKNITTQLESELKRGTHIFNAVDDYVVSQPMDPVLTTEGLRAFGFEQSKKVAELAIKFKSSGKYDTLLANNGGNNDNNDNSNLVKNSSTTASVSNMVIKLREEAKASSLTATNSASYSR